MASERPPIKEMLEGGGIGSPEQICELCRHALKLEKRAKALLEQLDLIDNADLSPGQSDPLWEGYHERQKALREILSKERRKTMFYLFVNGKIMAQSLELWVLERLIQTTFPESCSSIQFGNNDNEAMNNYARYCQNRKEGK